jgi:hypothetical protein
MSKLKMAGMGIGGYLLLAIVVFGLAGLGFAARYVFWPAEKKLERKVLVESHQYKQSAQEAVQRHIEAWNRLEADKARSADNPGLVSALEGQQRAIEAQIRRKMLNLAPGEIPAGAARFLGGVR